MKTITSAENPRIKRVKSLSVRKTREGERKYVIEGIHLVEEALRAPGSKIDSIFFSRRVTKTPEGEKLLNEILKSGIELIEVSDKIMAGLSEVDSPQGVLAVAGMPEYNVNDLLDRGDPLVVVCAGVQDPGNMGTIIRTADAFGASGVLYGGGSVDVYNPKTVRSSMGSIFHLPTVFFEDIKVGLKRLKEKGLKLVATALQGSLELSKADLTGGVAVVLGGEGAGLPSDIVASCDVSVRIPIVGKAESLNVAVAGSVVLYETMRQRMRNA